MHRDECPTLVGQATLALLGFWAWGGRGVKLLGLASPSPAAERKTEGEGEERKKKRKKLWHPELQEVDTQSPLVIAPRAPWR